MASIDFKSIINFSKTLSLLYVEDDASTRMQTKVLLNNFFDNITIAEDGEAGLAAYREGDFDLIISDINMPKMTGLQMLEKIRVEDEEILFLIISAHNEPDMFAQSIKLGTDGYLLKPIETASFMQLIYKTINKIKVKHENKIYKKELELINSDLEDKVQARTLALQEKLHYDDLTKAMSRYAFIKHLAIPKRGETPTLFLLNIDSFGVYNEIYGIEVGNEILVEFTKVLQVYADKYDYGLYRISGDEFVLYESTVFDNDGKNNERLNELFELFEHTKLWIESIHDFITLTATIGVSTESINTIGTADMALKYAKKSSEKYAIYHSSIDTKKDLKNILLWKKEIASALEEDRVIPFFQAIVNRDQEIIKYEALMRIKQVDENNEIKIVSPFFFLDISLKTKQYDALSYRLIDKATHLMQDKEFALSINMNQRDIHNEQLTTMLKERIILFNDDTCDKHIILEVLEDDDIHNYILFKERLSLFKDLGAKIAIDDFGSGFSNFSHIIGLSPHYVKIDGSLIKELDNNVNSYAIVKAIIQFAKSLGIKTIAEFVSSKEIFDVAYGLGIDEFQGYYFAEPLSIEEIEEKEALSV